MNYYFFVLIKTCDFCPHLQCTYFMEADEILISENIDWATLCGCLGQSANRCVWENMDGPCGLCSLPSCFAVLYVLYRASYRCSGYANLWQGILPLTNFRSRTSVNWMIMWCTGRHALFLKLLNQTNVCMWMCTLLRSVNHRPNNNDVNYFCVDNKTSHC